MYSRVKSTPHPDSRVHFALVVVDYIEYVLSKVCGDCHTGACVYRYSFYSEPLSILAYVIKLNHRFFRLLKVSFSLLVCLMCSYANFSHEQKTERFLKF